MTGLLLRRRLTEIRHAAVLEGRPGALLGLGLLGAAALLAIGFFAFEVWGAANAAAAGITAWSNTDTLTGPLSTAPPVYVLWREYVYWAATLGSATTAYAAHHALHRRRDWTILESLPIPQQATFHATLVDLSVALLIVPLAGTVLAVPLYWSRQWPAMMATLLVSWGLHGLSLAAAACIVPAAGHSATTGASEFKKYLSGNWAPAEFAPFFYAPAGVLAVTAFGGIALQKGVEDLVFGYAAGRGGIVLAVLAAASVVAFFVGRTLHVRSHARAVPLVRELELSMVAGEATEEAPPWGVWLGSLTPPAWRAVLQRDLRQMNRAARGRYALAALAAVGFALYALRAEAIAAWAPLAIAGGVAFIAAVSVRLAEPDLDVPWLRRALPRTGGGGVAVRSILGSFMALHLSLPAGLCLWLRDHGAEGLGVIVAAPVTASLGATLARATGSSLVARALFWLALASSAAGALWRPLAGAAVLLGCAAVSSLAAALRARD